MTRKEARKAIQVEALTKLRSLIKPGDTITTLVTHVTRSGMSRNIRLFLDGGKDEATALVSQALGMRLRHDWPYGIYVGGCGMDMCFWIVYQLGDALFPKGGPLKHSSREAQEKREGKKIESSGGYLLRRRDL